MMQYLAVYVGVQEKLQKKQIQIFYQLYNKILKIKAIPDYNVEISLNLDSLIKEDITPNQYIYLYCLYNNLPTPDYLQYEFDVLISKQYVDVITPGQITGSSKTKALFNEDASLEDFKLIWDTYPNKVPDGYGGFRILRTVDHNTKMFK